MMTLAKDLGRSLDEIMEMSTLEFRMWGAYYMLEYKDRERAMKNGSKRKHNTATGR